MGVKVKICGITNFKDAQEAVSAGCDALGFIFYKKSPRYINPLDARKIIARLPKKVLKVGVFVNEKEKRIKDIAKLLKLNMLQLHGEETPGFCRQFKGYKIIKAISVKNKLELKQILKYNPFAFLFDSFDAKLYGGSGKKFNWGLIRHINGIKQPIFLSGGLNVKNVKKAIYDVHPDWVDACSGLEKSAGRKDPKKVKRFIKIAKKEADDEVTG